MSKEVAVQQDQTLLELTNLADEAVKAYKVSAPLFKEIGDKVLNEILKADVIDSMDNQELFKLLELTTKNQLQPITELTKLTQSLVQLHDRRDIEKSKSAILDFTNELENAKKASTNKTISDFGNEIIEAELE